MKVAVWVMKPGPIAEVAMRKMAPMMGPRRRLAIDAAVSLAVWLVVPVCCASVIADPISIGGVWCAGRAAVSLHSVERVRKDC